MSSSTTWATQCRGVSLAWDVPKPGALVGCPRDVFSSSASAGGSMAACVLRTHNYCSGGSSLCSGVTACYFRSTAPTATGWGGARGVRHPPFPTGHAHSPALHIPLPLAPRLGMEVSLPKMADGKKMQGVGGMAEPPLLLLYRTARLGVLCPWTMLPGGIEPHPMCHCPRVVFRAVRNQPNPRQDLLPGPQICPDRVGVHSAYTSQPTSEEQKQNRGFPICGRSQWCGCQPAGPGATGLGMPRVTQPGRCHQGLDAGRALGVSQACGTLSISPALGSRVGSAGRAGDRVRAGDGAGDRNGIKP